MMKKKPSLLLQPIFVLTDQWYAPFPCQNFWILLLERVLSVG